MKGKNIIRRLLVLSMICIFLTGCEGQQESIQPSIDTEQTSTIELETEEESLEIEEQEFKIVFKYDCFNLDEVDFTYLPFKNQSEFENTIRDYIKGMTKYTGCEDWYLEYGDDIEECAITFKFDSISFGSYDNLGGKTDPVRKISDNKVSTTITLNRSHFESGRTHLAHELTHMIFGATFSQPICEGLCDYLSRKYEGEKSSYFSLKCNTVNDILKGYYEPTIREYYSQEELREYELYKYELMNSIASMGTGYSYGLSGSEASIWFNFSESFVGYLIEEYGIEKFMDFYKYAETEEDYVMLDPEGYVKIQNDWIKMYNEYESELDAEEFQKEIEEFMARSSLHTE